jgi:cyclic di-GMP phosphodiesterase
VGDQTTKGRVLVVDDEPAVCALLTERLGSTGYDCRSCESGQSALELLQAGTYKAIISDLNMPGISGLDLLETARHKYPHTAFLMVTGVDDIRIGIQAMKQGADDYLVKPFQFDVVVTSVERALEKKRLEYEVESYRQNLEGMVEQRTKQLQAAMKRIELTYDETLEALGAALDLRDNDTAGHSQRVSHYCLEMAKSMGVDTDRLKHIARGAYLHDIGKIGIPDAILLKPGKLTPQEKEIMESHARVGYDLVSRIAFLAPAAEIVLTHQERYDGTGYPQGLIGEEIPLGARVFAVADTLDAMTSDRPYRRALPFSTAKAEIQREAGRQFDPKVVEVFLGIPEVIWERVRQEVAHRRLHASAHPTSTLPARVPAFSPSEKFPEQKGTKAS